MKIVSLSLAAMLPDPDQPRHSIPIEELTALTESIRTHGLLLPLRVKPANAAGQHVIVSGHRRHAALLRLGLKSVDCVIVDGTPDPTAVLAEQLTENLLRQDLSPIDEADGYRRYLTLTNKSLSELADNIHVPATRISRALKLLDLPDGVRTAIHTKQVSKETGYYLSRLPVGAERDRRIAEALAGTLSRDEAVGAVRAARLPKADTKPVNRVTCRLTDGRSLTLVGKAVQLDELIDVLETVLKDARKARMQGWDVGTLTRVFRDRAAATAGGAS